MKGIAVAALVAAQVAGAQPVVAAELVESESQRIGAFAGVRVQMPLGADPQAQGLRADVAVAPTLRSQSGDGSIRTRFGEGVELGVRSDRPVALTLAGIPVHRLGATQDQTDSEDDGDGPSPLGSLAIGLGVGVVAAGLLIWALIE